MQLAKTLVDHLIARVTQVSMALESAVLTSMNAPQILITVTPMQHARTPKDHLSVSATQVSVALGSTVVTSMNAQCKRITVQ